MTAHSDAHDCFGRVLIPKDPEERAALLRDANLDDAERAAVELWCNLESIEDLLSPAERSRLYADLAEMAKQRVRAAVSAGHWLMS